MKLSVTDYTANLEAIATYIRQHYPSAATILLTPGQMDSSRLDAWEDTLEIPAQIRSPRRAENTIHYVDACLAVGRKLGIPVVNCFKLHDEAMKAGTSSDDLFSDGLHFTPAGYAVSLRRNETRDAWAEDVLIVCSLSTPRSRRSSGVSVPTWTP